MGTVSKINRFLIQHSRVTVFSVLPDIYALNIIKILPLRQKYLIHSPYNYRTTVGNQAGYIE